MIELFSKLQIKEINNMKHQCEEINVNNNLQFVDILNLSGNDDCFDDLDKRGSL
jgi:hypothetical protein